MTVIASRENLEYIFERAFFIYDPAKTGCVFDDEYTEYAPEARRVAILYVDEGLDLKTSIETVFEETFNDAYDKEMLQLAYEEIDKELAL